MSPRTKTKIAPVGRESIGRAMQGQAEELARLALSMRGPLARVAQPELAGLVRTVHEISQRLFDVSIDVLTGRAEVDVDELEAVADPHPLFPPGVGAGADLRGDGAAAVKTGGAVGHSTPGKVDSVPTAPHPSAPRRLKSWDVLLRYGINKPIFLETIQARNAEEARRIAREEIPDRHLRHFGRPPSVEYHLNGLIIRRATAEARAKAEKIDQGAEQLAAELETDAQRAKAAIEAQAPQVDRPRRARPESRPRGRTARATVATSAAQAKRMRRDINKTENSVNGAAG